VLFSVGVRVQSLSTILLKYTANIINTLTNKFIFLAKDTLFRKKWCWKLCHSCRYIYFGGQCRQHGQRLI